MGDIETHVSCGEGWGMCLLFHIGETTKICRKIKEKMKIFKIEGKTTKICRKIKEKMKVFKIEGKTTKVYS